MKNLKQTLAGAVAASAVFAALVLLILSGTPLVSPNGAYNPFGT